MPPKPAVSDEEGKVTDITALCHLVMSCDKFKCDSNYLAPILGIAQAKNVPRKINSIVNPYGFELKAGKIVARDGSAGIAAPRSQISKKTTPRKAAPTTPKTPASKKRKVDATCEPVVEPAAQICPAPVGPAPVGLDQVGPDQVDSIEQEDLMFGPEFMEAIEHSINGSGHVDLNEINFSQYLNW